MLPFPLGPLSVWDHPGMHWGKARKTQKLLHVLSVGPQSQPSAGSRPVESNGFLSTTVAQWLVGARLLPDTCPELPQSGKRLHGTAAQARRMVKWPPGQASTHTGEVDDGAAGMCGACARVAGPRGATAHQTSPAASSPEADGPGQVHSARRFDSRLHNPSPSTHRRFKIRRF